MAMTLAERVGRWDLAGHRSTSGELYNQMHERVAFLQRLHFDQYVPTLGPDHVTDFEVRLERWLDNVPSEEDQRILLELVPQIIFFGRDEFAKLHQAALRGPVTRWVIEQCGLNFGNPALQDDLVRELHDHTWFCAVSDSMQISDFCHANHLGGIQYRPDMRTLAKFGDLTKILTFMKGNGPPDSHKVALRRIVILEDFIGSGTQLLDARDIIDGLLAQNVPILLVPLIICPDGVNLIHHLFGGNPQFRLDPVLRLDAALFINAASVPVPNSLAAKLKDLAIRS